MKTIEDTYSDHAKDEREGMPFYGPSDYEPLLRSFEYEILLQVNDKNCQGDSRLIYRNGDQYGMLVFGWGSCSGCDSLQACDNMKEIAELRDSLHGQIKWDSLRGLHDYIVNKDWELEYYWNADETKDFVEKAKVLLGNLLENANVDSVQPLIPQD